jgi:hypothetical protein
MLSRLADGDRGAMALLFAVAWPVVRDFATRVLPGAAAEDVA